MNPPNYHPQKHIPCLFMRGGTSRGPYFNRGDLPQDLTALSRVLIAAVGAGHPLNIDGIGGGNPVTTKVAMLSKSSDSWADIDYFFAQVAPDKPSVDYAPTCGNILSAVGPAALEMGLAEMQGDTTAGTTPIKILSTNTGARIEAIVQTPLVAGKRIVNYAGTAEIAGVPNTAAPVILNFMDVVGSKTGHLFPTGKPCDMIDGIALTCIDVAMPMVIGRARDFGITGYETAAELDANSALFARFEPLRIKAGMMMGLGNADTLVKSVVPKFALLAEPQKDGAVAARYFMPWKTHPSYAVTGSICTGACLLAQGTVGEGLARLPQGNPAQIKIEHPSGLIDVVFDYSHVGGFSLHSAGLLRTARKLFSGDICIPANAWEDGC